MAYSEADDNCVDLTVREYLAAHALGGLLSNSRYAEWSRSEHRDANAEVVKDAFAIADMFLAKSKEDTLGVNQRAGQEHTKRLDGEASRLPGDSS